MRLAVFLAAHLIKIYIRLRMITRRDAMILTFTTFALLVLALTIMGERQNAKHRPTDLYCADRAQKSEAEERCEFKLRDVRSGHSALTRL